MSNRLSIRTETDRRRAIVPTIARRMVWWMLLAVLMLSAGFDASAVRADSYDDARVRMGARLFRGVLAADVGLDAKRAGSGALTVLLYADDPRIAAEIGRLIAPPEGAGNAPAQVRGMPLDLREVSHWPFAGAAPVAVFLATEPSSDELDRLIRWSIESKVILVSPFEGHVERGAMVGLSVGANVKLFVNLRSLAAGGVTLKPLLLKVAKAYP